MTGLNIQFLSLFEYDVIIWHFFIRMLGYYCSNAVGRIVKIFPLLGEEFIRGQEAQKARGQAGLEDRKVRRYEDRPFTVKSLSSYPPTLISSDNPLPQSLPQGREAEKCASRFTLHTSLKKQAAFTLAEVLITLGIIGVVAAMTMPVLIQNHREKVTVTQLKKTYSVLSQAMLMAVNENGTADMWDAYQSENDGDSEESVTRFTPVNLVKQLKVAKDCGFTSNGCFPAAEYKALNGAAERDFENLSRYYKIVLSDGTMLALEGYEPQKDVFDGVEDRAYGEIWVDTNGKKFPNKVGKDLFLFLYKKDRILPYGYNNTDKPLSSTGCSTAGTGYGCTAWVLYNENMDYLHCDDLSWTGKRQCK